MSNRQRMGTSTHASYHPGGYGVSEGLKRARRPYLVRNIATGSVISAFATSVYLYSINKVKQDDFSDLVDVRAPQPQTTVQVAKPVDVPEKKSAPAQQPNKRLV